jgi:broad specificity phosphatase PhoE
MTVRLVWAAHGPTAGLRRAAFGDTSPLENRAEAASLACRVRSSRCGPEPACVETAQAAGLSAEPDDRIAGLDPGVWRGLTLTEVVESDPDGIGAWLSDPTAAPHGGESLAALVRRVGGFSDRSGWEPGRHLMVVTPLVARAAAVHALGAPAATMFRLDVAPLQRVTMSRRAGTWRLTGLG